jgi:hypothetical protein
MANIALNKPILENEWLRPEELTKNNYKTYTGTKGFTEAIWPINLTLDLQEIYYIETIRFLLWAKDQRVYKYRLLTSIDSITWDVHFDSSQGGSNGWQEFCFQEKILIRYIRIQCLWNSSNAAFHIVEMQVYDEDTENLEITVINKRIIRSKQNGETREIGDGLPLTQKINNLTNSLERTLKENPLINPDPFQEIIKNFRIQAYDIESLEISLESIRREIINPVKNELEEGKRLGRFSVWGFYVGFAGIVVSIFAILNGIFKWI